MAQALAFARALGLLYAEQCGLLGDDTSCGGGQHVGDEGGCSSGAPALDSPAELPPGLLPSGPSTKTICGKIRLEAEFSISRVKAVKDSMTKSSEGAFSQLQNQLVYMLLFESTRNSSNASPEEGEEEFESKSLFNTWRPAALAIMTHHGLTWELEMNRHGAETRNGSPQQATGNVVLKAIEDGKLLQRLQRCTACVAALQGVTLASCVEPGRGASDSVREQLFAFTKAVITASNAGALPNVAEVIRDEAATKVAKFFASGPVYGKTAKRQKLALLQALQLLALQDDEHTFDVEPMAKEVRGPLCLRGHQLFALETVKKTVSTNVEHVFSADHNKTQAKNPGYSEETWDFFNLEKGTARRYYANFLGNLSLIESSLNQSAGDRPLLARGMAGTKHAVYLRSVFKGLNALAKHEQEWCPDRFLARHVDMVRRLLAVLFPCIPADGGQPVSLTDDKLLVLFKEAFKHAITQRKLNDDHLMRAFVPAAAADAERRRQVQERKEQELEVVNQELSVLRAAAVSKKAEQIRKRRAVETAMTTITQSEDDPELQGLYNMAKETLVASKAVLPQLELELNEANALVAAKEERRNQLMEELRICNQAPPTAAAPGSTAAAAGGSVSSSGGAANQAVISRNSSFALASAVQPLNLSRPCPDLRARWPA